MPTSRAPAHKPCGMLEMTGTPVRASIGAMISSVLNPPQERSSESASGTDSRTRALNSRDRLRHLLDVGHRLDAEPLDHERLKLVLDQERSQPVVHFVVVRGRDGDRLAPTAFRPSMTPLLMVVAGNPDAVVTVSRSCRLNASPL